MKLKITIIGKVHGVGYRLHLLNLADSLFIERFDARNVKIDGKQAVVVLVEGDEETLKEFVELVKTTKPEKAVVEDIKVEEFKGRVRTIDSYRNSLMIEQLNKIVQVGLNMLEKQDETIKKIEELSEKIDESTRTICDKIDDSTKVLSEKIDKVSEKIDESSKSICDKIDESTEKLCSKIDDLRLDLKSYLDERLKKLEEDVRIIKSKLGLV
ncbi:acylphosphatase [Archaeoglobus sp.]